MELEVGDTVLCTVDRIVGTTVFVHLDNHGVEGSIVVSEISPGRIRNLRDFVVPKKKIVCKVLRTSKGNVELSLRRVTLKEKNEVMNAYKQERRYKSILKSVLGNDTNKFLLNLKDISLSEFMSEAKSNPNVLNKYLDKSKSEKISEILGKDKTKKSIVKKEISLKSTNPQGLNDIKSLFESVQKNVEVLYISGGKYTLKVESSDLKKADNELNEVINEIEKKSKRLGIEFKGK